MFPRPVLLRPSESVLEESEFVLGVRTKQKKERVTDKVSVLCGSEAILAPTPGKPCLVSDPLKENMDTRIPFDAPGPSLQTGVARVVALSLVWKISRIS